MDHSATLAEHASHYLRGPRSHVERLRRDDVCHRARKSLEAGPGAVDALLGRPAREHRGPQEEPRGGATGLNHSVFDACRHSDVPIAGAEQQAGTVTVSCLELHDSVAEDPDGQKQ